MIVLAYVITIDGLVIVLVRLAEGCKDFSSSGCY